MLIGVLSDTHGRVDRTQQAVRLLESLRVERVLHCGDVGSLGVLELLGAWPTEFVLGNVDSPWALRDAVLAEGHTCHDRFGSLAWEGKQIALLHGDEQRRLREAIHGGHWDLVCCGHTHQAEITTVDRTLVLNPGALHRSSRPSIAVVELPGLRASLVSL